MAYFLLTVNERKRKLIESGDIKMPDPLSLINPIIDGIKKLKEINETVKNAEITTLISNLQLAVADLKLELADERDKNAELQSKIRELNEQLDIVNTVRLENNFIYREKDDCQEGPYCPRCFSRDRKLVDLLEIQNRAYGCSLCQFVLKKDGSGLMSRDKTLIINSYLK